MSTNTKCPCCWQPAYMGFMFVECATRDCPNFSPKMLGDNPHTDNREFKIGDRVRIIALKNPPHRRSNWWAKEMENFVGGNGTILRINSLEVGDEYALLKDCTREGMSSYAWWLCSLEKSR